MSESRRVLRFERELKETLARLLHQGLKLPIPGYAAIVHVDVTADLRSAKVFVRVAGSEEARSEAERLLNEQRPWLQRQVAAQLQTRFCPVLNFKVGGSPQEPLNDEVEKLLANLNRPEL